MAWENSSGHTFYMMTSRQSILFWRHGLWQVYAQWDKLNDSKKLPERGLGHTLAKVSLVVAVVAGVVGLFFRWLSREVLVMEELVPLPAIHLRPDILFVVGPVPVSNALLSAWVVTLALMGGLGLALGLRRTPFPQLLRSTELLLESLSQLFQRVAGERQSLWTFSFIATLFLYMIGNAWVTLLPVYGPVQFHSSDGLKQSLPLLRGAGTDINMALAVVVAGVYVEFHGVRTRGMAYMWEIFPLRPFRPFLQKRVLTGLYEVYLAVLHELTHLARLFRFTFRLFGTLTAGGLLRLVLLFLSPLMLVVPFYGLQILLGLLQAFVFAGLILAFLKLAEGPDGGSPSPDARI